MRYRFSNLLVILLAGLFISCSTNKKQEKIRFGNEQWSISRAMNYLGKILLEQNGIPAEVVDLSVEQIYSELRAGKIDVFMDSWSEGHGVYLYDFQDADDLGLIYDGCLLGMGVPSYFEVDSISELSADPSLYDNVFYGIQKDAGVMISAVTAMKQYGMHPTIVNMNEDELIKQIDIMTSKEQNFVVSVWRPHWKIKAYDLKFLIDTTNSFISNDKIHGVARADFSKDNPRAAKILSKITFSDDEIMEYLKALKGAKKGEEIESRIQDWMKLHPEKVAFWSATD